MDMINLNGYIFFLTRDREYGALNSILTEPLIDMTVKEILES